MVIDENNIKILKVLYDEGSQKIDDLKTLARADVETLDNALYILKENGLVRYDDPWWGVSREGSTYVEGMELTYAKLGGPGSNGQFLIPTKSGTIRVITGKLGEKIIQENPFRTMADTHELFVYKNGVYIPGENLILERCQDLVGSELIKTQFVNEALAYIQRKTFTERSEFDYDINIINIKNGLYNISEGGLTKHTEKYLSIYQLDIEGDKNAECPAFEKFLEEILPEEVERLTIQEWFGYCLYKKYHIQEILVLVGGGSNGKTTLLNVLIELIGSQYVSSVSLKALTEDKFAIASLFNKRANIVDDLPAEKILNTGNVKSATGGGQLEGQRKFGHSFVFNNFAKFIFSCNEVPETKDDTDANYRRWGYIDFNQRFEGDCDDKEMIDKITTSEEMAGIFKWSLVGLNRLLKNNHFSNHKTIEERRDETIKRSKSVHYYAEQMLDIDNDAHIEKADLYEDYVHFCKENKIMHKTIIAFGRDFGDALPNVRSIKRGQAGNRYTAWGGAKFIDGKILATRKSVSCHRWGYIPKSSMTSCKNRDKESSKCHRCHRYLVSNRMRDKETNEKSNCKIGEFTNDTEECKNKYDIPPTQLDVKENTLTEKETEILLYVKDSGEALSDGEICSYCSKHLQMGTGKSLEFLEHLRMKGFIIKNKEGWVVV